MTSSESLHQVGLVRREPQFGAPERKIVEVPEQLPAGTPVFVQMVTKNSHLSAMNRVRARLETLGWRDEGERMQCARGTEFTLDNELLAQIVGAALDISVLPPPPGPSELSE